MRRFAVVVLLFLLSHSALCQSSKTKDFDFAVWQVEENYAGFPSKVVPDTKEDYQKLKEQLRNQIELGNQQSDDAIGQYVAWFEDFHLSYGQHSDRYMRDYKFYRQMDYDPQAVQAKIDDHTYLIRIPSFDGEVSMSWVKGSIKKYLESGCENLILDIRGNGGGSDHFVEPYVELLYDKAGLVYGVEVRNTKRYQGEIKKLSAREKFLGPVYQTMVASDDQFVTLVASDTVRYDKVSAYPKRAALIIDRYVASSAEGLVLQLRATSDRTTVYGKDNTLGCCDFSNCTQIAVKGKTNVLTIPMTRSLGVAEGRSVDKEGIAPDIRIDLPLPEKLTDNIDEWVLWIANDLKKTEVTKHR